MKNTALWCIIAFLLGSCQAKHQAEEEKIPKLEVSSPLLKDTLVTRVYVSQIRACKHIELRALERGYLEQIFVDEGQTVKQHQPMFKILPNVFEAELQKMKAESEIARIEYESTKMLAEKNVVSQNELALAKAKLGKANAEVMLAETHLGFTNIRAPFSGIMDHLHVREGSLLDEGELLTTLSDNSKMWIYFNVPEAEYLDYISSKGMLSQKTVRLQLANGQIFPYAGQIETIEGEFNNETGNIEFRATFPNPEKVLRHGETGNVLLSLPYKNALLIPQKATFEILDEKYVYVINAENKLEQRRIKVAAEIPHFFVLQSGLSVQDKILIEGLRRVRNGQEIEANFKAPEKLLSEFNLHAE
jgi:membrane fusion protein (multidrug efflux system)